MVSSPHEMFNEERYARDRAWVRWTNRGQIAFSCGISSLKESKARISENVCTQTAMKRYIDASPSPSS